MRPAAPRFALSVMRVEASDVFFVSYYLRWYKRSKKRRRA